MVKLLGDIGVLRSELPSDWFALYGFGDGVVVQAGPAPERAPVASDGKQARLVLPNALFKPLRAPDVGMHTGSVNGEPRLAGWAAQQWLKRLDVKEEELIAYKNKLLGEPKLTPANTLPERLKARQRPRPIECLRLWCSNVDIPARKAFDFVYCGTESPL